MAAKKRTATSKSTKHASKPTKPASKPTKPASKPTKPASKSTKPASKSTKPARKPAKSATPRAGSARGAASKPRLLSGGNPQIAKGDGDAPVRAYIAAMPGWKREVGAHLDALIARAVPGVRRAVKWNSPFYGIAGRGWFVGMHCFERYIKIAFFRGTSLVPMPPEGSKSADVRYLHVTELGVPDEAQFMRWIARASELPGGDGLGPCEAPRSG
jgi:hypothetical protein